MVWTFRWDCRKRYYDKISREGAAVLRLGREQEHTAQFQRILGKWLPYTVHIVNMSYVYQLLIVQLTYTA